MENENRLWALREAAKPRGIMPHAASTKGFLVSLEIEGLLRQSDRDPVWYITDKGRAALLEGERGDDHRNSRTG